MRTTAALRLGIGVRRALLVSSSRDGVQCGVEATHERRGIERHVRGGRSERRAQRRETLDDDPRRAFRFPRRRLGVSEREPPEIVRAVVVFTPGSINMSNNTV